jgi:hypothetical protein
MDHLITCYLLTPEPIRENGEPNDQRWLTTYVGFTLHPFDRLHRHNGELAGGPLVTVDLRPWEMIVIVHGFPIRRRARQSLAQLIVRHAHLTSISSRAFMTGTRFGGAETARALPLAEPPDVPKPGACGDVFNCAGPSYSTVNESGVHVASPDGSGCPDSQRPRPRPRS